MENINIKNVNEFESQNADQLTSAVLKAMFSNQENNEVLIDFLNTVLPQNRRVKNLARVTMKYAEVTPEDPNVMMGLQCEDEDGRTFVVELRKSCQDPFFKQCTWYVLQEYQRRASFGKFDNKIPAVVLIEILGDDDLDRSHPTWEHRYISKYSLREVVTNEPLNDSIQMIFVELKRFNKTWEACQTAQDKWCCILKNIIQQEI